MVFVGIYIIIFAILAVAFVGSFCIEMLFDFPEWNKFEIIACLFMVWFGLGLIGLGVFFGYHLITEG